MIRIISKIPQIVVPVRTSCIRRRLFYNEAGQTFSYRDVVVLDSNFDLLQWLSDHQKTITSLKHPSSGHALSGYANSDYHRPYNYNNIGEFSLNLAAGQYLAPRTSTVPPSTSPGKRHDIIIWPDALYVSNLVAQDIAVLYPFLSSEKPIDVSAVKEKLNPAAAFDSLHHKTTDMTIMVNVSKHYPATRMQQVVKWFQDCLLAWPGVDYVVSTELSEHRNATQIMVLPFEDCFEGILTSTQVKKIVDKYVQLLQPFK